MVKPVRINKRGNNYQIYYIFLLDLLFGGYLFFILNCIIPSSWANVLTFSFKPDITIENNKSTNITPIINTKNNADGGYFIPIKNERFTQIFFNADTIKNKPDAINHIKA